MISLLHFILPFSYFSYYFDKFRVLSFFLSCFLLSSKANLNCLFPIFFKALLVIRLFPVTVLFIVFFIPPIQSIVFLLSLVASFVYFCSASSFLLSIQTSRRPRFLTSFIFFRWFSLSISLLFFFIVSQSPVIFKSKRWYRRDFSANEKVEIPIFFKALLFHGFFTLFTLHLD